MELLLRRWPSSDRSTSGRLFIDGKFALFTLEDIVREGPKVMHETAIPEGRYRVVITSSRRFKRMLPEILDVPGFTGIRIHPGNTDQDTSGCILVGRSAAVNSLSDSRLAMEQLQPQIAGALARAKAVWLTIEPAMKVEALNA